MSDKSAIEWTDATWNPIRARYVQIQDDGSGKTRIGWHCEHVSEGCRFCYAESFNLRLGTGRASAAYASAYACAYASADAAEWEPLMLAALDGVLRIGKQAEPIEQARVVAANEAFQRARERV